MQKLSELLDRVIYLLYLAVAIATPLIFTTSTTEIYEVPKMFFVYFATTFILFATIIKFAIHGKIKLPTGLPILAFAILALTQLASTLTSTDYYTSIFGYPTRLSGGLLSTFAYLILFAGALINFNAEKAKTLILATIFTAVAVALWGIPSHFNLDPSCLVLTGKLNSSCWAKDFDPALRIFSTLGQPNWLASYLVLLLPITFVFSFLFKKQKQIIFALSSIFIYWAIILTNSRAGLIGLIVALLLSLILLGKKALFDNKKILIFLVVSYAILTFAFADFIAQRLPQAPKTIPTSTNQATESAPVTQQTLGTESGQIRLIVWQGAINVWKNWPILGPGPETFVNTYYLFRPEKHNRTSEWEYFYNKVHNEFLNYLASSGILGFTSYIFLLAALFWKIYKTESKDTYIISVKKATIAGILGYLVTIFFGFSTVATQTAFTLLAACALILTTTKNNKDIKIKLLETKFIKVSSVVFILLVLTFSYVVLMRTLLANILEKNSEIFAGSRSLLQLKNAITTTQFTNPYLLANFSYETAAYSQKVEDSENLKKTVEESKNAAKKALELAPNNYLITQKIAKAYVILLEVDDVKNEANKIAEQLTKLAPNYPPAYLLKAQIYTSLQDKDKALLAVQKTLDLKPEYLEAQKLRDQLTITK